MDAADQATGPALCYVRNDLPTAFVGSVTVEAIHYLSGHVTPLSSAKVSLPAGGGTLGFFCAAAYFRLNGRFLRAFSPKTGVNWVDLAEMRGHIYMCNWQW